MQQIQKFYFKIFSIPRLSRKIKKNYQWRSGPNKLTNIINGTAFNFIIFQLLLLLKRINLLNLIETFLHQLTLLIFLPKDWPEPDSWRGKSTILSTESPAFELRSSRRKASLLSALYTKRSRVTKYRTFLDCKRVPWEKIKIKKIFGNSKIFFFFPRKKSLPISIINAIN